MVDNFDPHAYDINWSPTPSPVGTQAGIYDTLNKGYAGAIASQPKTPDLLTKYDERFGIPQMQENIQRGTETYDYLGNQIRGIPNDIAQRSRESILTQGQKNRQVQSEQTPLLEQQNLLGQNLSRMQTNLGMAQTNASRMVSAEQVDQEKALLPWLKQYDTENIMSAMRLTGWTTENRMELDRLLANQSAGITLNEGEKSRLNALALEERRFENQLKLQQNSQSFTASESAKDRLLALASNY